MRRLHFLTIWAVAIAGAALSDAAARGESARRQSVELSEAILVSDFDRVSHGLGTGQPPSPLPTGSPGFVLGPTDSGSALSPPAVSHAGFAGKHPILTSSPPCAGCGDAPDWQMLPPGLIYAPYLAGPKESRFRSVWNEENNDGDIWDITLGGRVALLRYGPVGTFQPVGWELGIEGAGLVRLDRDSNMDVTAADYRFGIPLTWGNSVSQVKFAYYHLSSHLGDEFLLDNVGFPRLNYSRDVLVLGYSWYPDERWRIYGEAGYGVVVDVAEPWEFQFGVEWAPRGRTGPRGEPFAAFNGQLREEVDFGGNVVAQAGWAWRRSAYSGVFRVGVEYYNGKNEQFSFFDDSEQKVGFGIWYDY